MDDHKVTKEQLEHMQHCVGFFSENPGYRNYYCASGKDIDCWMDLVSMGLADAGRLVEIERGDSKYNQQYFELTADGMRFIGLPEQQRQMDVFKSRIKDIHEYYEEELGYEL